MSAISGLRIHINGIVQGVGFRPFIFNLAKTHQLVGWVRNSAAGVDIELDGAQHTLETFIQDIKTQAPPLSKIDEFTIGWIPPQGFQTFEIVHSTDDPNAFVPISPDVTICEDCLAELFDPQDHRYRYPFINCTNCGPRFTIIKEIPYDRPFTTMASFELCPTCRAEYEDPSNRRFHAQPVACPNCGPHIWLENSGSEEILAEKEAALQLAREMLKAGKIIAIKGLGGFHLACDATNPAAVETLRQRKLRVDKPFAVMCATIEDIKTYCQLSDFEEQLVLSRERPIVIVPQKSNNAIAEQVAPGQSTLGVMLPYTPLHALLLEPAEDFPSALVMTSGNLSEEPITTTNQAARQHLSPLADALLLHNREIYIRCDDSVMRAAPPNPTPAIYALRRSRGYAPFPLLTQWRMPSILAAGAELKNTFCLTKEKYAFLSHHIGDLENYETLQSLEHGVKHFEKLFRITPEVIAYDLHPNYMATRYAQQRASNENLPAFGIQHHHAHIAACMAENGIPSQESVIGISFDGTGYGTDGTIWGGEVLLSGYQSFERALHLKPIPLPGGDAATKEPWRFALSWMLAAGHSIEEAQTFFPEIPPASLEMVAHQIKSSINAPLTSSMGRLFDAVAALVGIRHQVNYEAQAAIELEQIVDTQEEGTYPFTITGKIIDPAPMMNQIIADRYNKVPQSTIAAKFHNTIAAITLAASNQLRDTTGLHRVALSGGVWQNMVLLEKSIQKLSDSKFEVLLHKDIPANDGGLALGQAIIAYHTMIH